jgi:FkbM family methyltransferase
MNLFKQSSKNGIYVQIGAGAGDKDSRAKYRDGFSETIKNLSKNDIKKILLVEPNPINIPFLKQSWKDYPEAIIIQKAIVPKNYKNNTVKFYYAPDDGPHYQVASLNPAHIIKHYNPKIKIETIDVPTIHLEDLLKEILNDEKIDLLSLDIEGLDAEIVLDTDFNNINLKFLSIERIHLGDLKDDVSKHLQKFNFIYRGIGVDYSGIDDLYEKLK